MTSEGTSERTDMDPIRNETHRLLWYPSVAIALVVLIARPSRVVILISTVSPIFLVVLMKLMTRRKRPLAPSTHSSVPPAKFDLRSFTPLKDVYSHTPTSTPLEDVGLRTFPTEETDLRTSVLLEEALRDSSNKDTALSLRSIDVTHRLLVGEFRDRGGFADVYEGLLSTYPVDMTHDPATQTKVAVKVVRIFVSGQHIDGLRRKMRSFAREMIIWTSLKHDNVLPCLGFAEHNNLPALVSEWMENGNIIEYLTKNDDVDRVIVAKGVASGLEYIHNEGIVHSDLKGANILVNTAGAPMLSDFGISRLVRDEVTVTGTTTFKFSSRWLAVELVEPSDLTDTVRLHTKKTDIWALGMVLYEILTLKPPFYGTDEVAVISVIANGKLPEKPSKDDCATEDLDFLWELCTQCWRKEPDTRPTATEASRLLSTPRAFTMFLRASLRGFPNPSLPPLGILDASGRIELGQLSVCGRTADVFDGLLKRNRSHTNNVYETPKRIAVKLFRVLLHNKNDDKPELYSIVKIFRIWVNLKHDNVLQCLGFAECDDRPALISEWMSNGTLIEFLVNNDNADRLNTAKGIVYGLKYIHESGIVHSDLKGSKILISSEGVPMLSICGCSQSVDDEITTSEMRSFKCSINWMAIELVSDTEGTAKRKLLHTKKSDIWSLGMVFYEILSLKRPFHNIEETLIPTLIANGQLPDKPTEDSWSDDVDEIWRVCERCWEKNPDDRPTANEISHKLGMRVELSMVQAFNAHSDSVSCIVISPIDAYTLATASHDNTVCVWTLSKNGKTATRRHQLTGHTRDVTSIAWSSDGLFLVSGSTDNTIRKWCLPTGECELVIQASQYWVSAVALSPDNKHVVSSGFFGSIYAWDTSTGNKIFGPLLDHASNAKMVVYSPDGRLILSGSTDKTIIAWDSETGTKLFGPITVDSDVNSISFHPSGKTFVTGSNNGGMTTWNTSTFQPIREDQHTRDSWIVYVQHSLDGKFILSTTLNGILGVWDAERGRAVSKPVENRRGVGVATLSPDIQWVVSGDIDGMVQIWQVREVDAF